MALGPRIGPQLSLRQSQTLVMTPQLRQAIKLLQYSNLELADFVQEELDRNPLLEREEAAEPGEEALSERVAPNDDLVAAVGAFQADGGAEPIAEAVADRIEEAAGAVSSRADWTESRVSDGQWEASDRARVAVVLAGTSGATAPARLFRRHRSADRCPAHRRAGWRRPHDGDAGRGGRRAGGASGACRGRARADDAIRSGRAFRPRPAGMPPRPAYRPPAPRPGDGLPGR